MRSVAGRNGAVEIAEGSLDTVITWRLEPEGSGTRLFLRHAGFQEGSDALKGMGSGWPTLLRRLEPSLP